MRTGKLIFAGLLAVTAGMPSVSNSEETNVAKPESSGSTIRIAEQPEMALLARPNAWINSPPLTASQLRGKVVLVDFWTYTCINWRRTLPYLRAWHDKYRGQGLVVIGIHTPEFPFERDLSNVRQAVKDMRIDYPVVTDNDETIWRAFHNQLWPTFYLIDPEGRIKYQLSGERSYDRAETIVRKMLSENGKNKIDPGPAPMDAAGFEVAPDSNDLKSSENYVGYQITRNFASPGGLVRDRSNAYKAPAQLRVNEWALSGRWTATKENIVLDEPRGTYRFHARDLHLVMGLPTSGAGVKFRVLIDGHPPGAAHGLDVDEKGEGIVNQQRLYQLARQPMPIMDRQIDIEFFGSGVEVFDFTFG